jgi:SAM-dependent methyltransferase
MKFNASIEGPIFIGRSWAEYIKMFDLDISKLKNRKILDCAAGASSFTGFMNKNGYDVIAADVLYDKSPDFLQKKCKDHLQILVDALDKMQNQFEWDFFENLNDLKEHRLASCRDFGADYAQNKGYKYLKADLNQLPFSDNTFDMVLCAHLLFIYDHRLTWDFHQKAVNEMIRVTSSEVRIYPLVKHKGKKSLFVNKIINGLNEEVRAQIVKVDYQFRKGGDEMLLLTKKS